MYLVEITLKEELLEDVDELGERGEAALEVLDQLGRLDAVEQVERDVHLDVRQPVRQLDDRDLQKFKICLLEQVIADEKMSRAENAKLAHS